MLNVQAEIASPLPASADPEILDRPSPTPSRISEACRRMDCARCELSDCRHFCHTAAGSRLAGSSESGSFSSHRSMTRAEMENRRFEAAGAFRLGLSQFNVAQQFGVSRMTASRWARKYREGGVDSMRLSRATGRPRRLTEKQRAEVAGLIQRDPDEFGFDRWSCRALAIVIEDRFGIKYHPDHVSRILHRLFPDGGFMFWRRGGAR